MTADLRWGRPREALYPGHAIPARLESITRRIYVIMRILLRNIGFRTSELAPWCFAGHKGSRPTHLPPKPFRHAAVVGIDPPPRDFGGRGGRSRPGQVGRVARVGSVGSAGGCVIVCERSREILKVSRPACELLQHLLDTRIVAVDVVAHIPCTYHECFGQ